MNKKPTFCGGHDFLPCGVLPFKKVSEDAEWNGIICVLYNQLTW
jgi:hypothetical protein